MNDDARPILIALDLADALGLRDRVTDADERTGVVRMTEGELLAVGADRVEWGEPDERGRYTPTLYRNAPVAIP